MPQYQSFPDTAGDSRSLDKLKALRFPDVRGRAFLDVGCNEGFFCGFAYHAKATRVVGIDYNDEFIRRAQTRFPECTFLAQGWDHLPEGPFDVILLASALHYADDQPALIKKLMDRLAPDGVLVLELGIVSSDKAEWVTVKRGIDQRQFPTMPLLDELFDEYAWKWVGPSVKQSGDPVPRHVVHVSHRRPVAYLLMQPPASGKSSIAKRLFAPAGVPVVSGDAVLLEIAQGKRQVPDSLRKLVQKKYSALAADQTIRQIFAKKLGSELVRAWLTGTGNGDVAVDGFVPPENHQEVVSEIGKAGYLPITLNWQRPAHALLSDHGLSDQADGYYRSLGAKLPEPVVAASKLPVSSTGYVDSIAVSSSGITIRGWAIDENGQFPAQLVVGIGSERTVVSSGLAQDRADVQKHLDWKHAQLGYAITFADAGVASAKELGDRGFSVSLMSGASLRMSPVVRHALAGTA